MSLVSQASKSKACIEGFKEQKSRVTIVPVADVSDAADEDMMMRGTED